MKNIITILALTVVVIMVAACGTAGGGAAGGAAAPQPADAGQAAAPAAQPAAEAGDNFNAHGYPIVNERITLRGFGNINTTHSDWDTLLAFQVWEEKSNISIDWEQVPNDAFTERRNLVFASGMLPDFFYRSHIPVSDQITHGGNGMLLRLNDLIDAYAHNFNDRVAEFPDARRGITLPDGSIFSLPVVMPPDLPTIYQQGWMNHVWLERLGIPVPETTDEIKQALIAFRDFDANGNGDPTDEIPYSCRNRGTSIMRFTFGAFGIGNLGGVGMSAWVDQGPDGMVRFFPVTDEFRNQLEWINSLWEEGLMDVEMFTQGAPEFTAKANQDLIGAFFSNDNNQQLGALSYQFGQIRAPMGPDGHRAYNHIGSSVISGAFAISSSNPYPRETLRWVDFFYGYEGSRLIRIGVEGVTFDVMPDGSYRIIDDIMFNPDGLTVSQAMGRFAISFAGGGCPDFVFRSFELARLPPESPEWMDFILQDLDPRFINPVFLFTAEEQAELNPIASDVVSYVDEMRVAFKTGTRSFDEWDDFVTQLERMNIQRYVEIYQAALDRFLAG